MTAFEIHLGRKNKNPYLIIPYDNRSEAYAAMLYIKRNWSKSQTRIGNVRGNNRYRLFCTFHSQVENKPITLEISLHRK